MNRCRSGSVVERLALKSSNPVLLSRGFKRQGGWKTTARQPLVGVAVGRYRIGTDCMGGSRSLPQLVADLMTMKGVLARTCVAFALTVLMTVLSWTVPPVPPTSLGRSYGIAGGAGTVAAALVLIQCRRSRPSPGLTLAHAVAEGLFLGVLSNTVSAHVSSGVFVQFVLGTLAAFGGVLVAYALRCIPVARRWYGFVCAAAVGLSLLITADLLLSPFLGADGLGFRSVAAGVFFGVAGVGLAVPFLALHFRQVEDGLTHGAPRQEAWAAALGLTLTLVWLYLETLRWMGFVPTEDL
ncbi:Bax inhibitor-1/YccA family protein [Streptomyces sp. NPDC004589]|uniref:Bax inhibitor-1/YccA family protein n=1 Tax=Streptomyces sp. NPDC004589 TaxID=3154553 RepID=UPI0033A9C6CC